MSGIGFSEVPRQRRSGRGLRRGDARLRLIPILSGLLLFTGLPRAIGDEAARTADELLRLVPADATVVLAVEGLRDQYRALSGSRLVADLRRLPAVRAWLESEKHRHFEKSCSEIEGFLGVKLSDLRDELIGDAAVLVLRLDPDAPPDPRQARGLFLLRARDPALLERLIARINASQQDSGELERIEDRVSYTGTTYHVRRFPAASGRPPESYVSYPDGTFAFSNAASLIQGVIERKGRAAGAGARTAPTNPGLADLPRFQALRSRLPDRALARLFVDPRAIERLLASAPRAGDSFDVRLVAVLARYLAAVDYAGAALNWNAEQVVIHAVETLNPSRLDPWLRGWAADSRTTDPVLRRVPATALALASAHVNPPALWDAASQLVLGKDQNRLRNVESVLTGLLLGQDLRTRILPGLGPGLIAYLDAPPEPPAEEAGRGPLFPLVVAIGFSRDATLTPSRADGPSVTLAAALENALHTLMALTALDEKRGQGRSRIATRQVAGATVTTLDIPLPFAYAVDSAHGRLVLGTSAVAVARYLESTSDPEAGRGFRELQAAAFPDAGTFLCLDLDALTRLAGRHRDRLVRNIAARQKRTAADVGKDLDHVLALARLFRAAFLTSRMEPDAAAVHRTVGVILHREESPPAGQP
jgi:hypothetical protein